MPSPRRVSHVRAGKRPSPSRARGSRPPVGSRPCRLTSRARPTPPIIDATATNEATLSCDMPDRPCPTLQPPATSAPKPSRNPPTARPAWRAASSPRTCSRPARAAPAAAPGTMPSRKAMSQTGAVPNAVPHGADGARPEPRIADPGQHPPEHDDDASASPAKGQYHSEARSPRASPEGTRRASAMPGDPIRPARSRPALSRPARLGRRCLGRRCPGRRCLGRDLLARGVHAVLLARRLQRSRPGRSSRGLLLRGDPLHELRQARRLEQAEPHADLRERVVAHATEQPPRGHRTHLVVELRPTDAAPLVAEPDERLSLGLGLACGARVQHQYGSSSSS